MCWRHPLSQAAFKNMQGPPPSSSDHHPTRNAKYVLDANKLNDMSDKRFIVPVEVQHRVLLQGSAGAEWVEGLEPLVEKLERTWSLSIGSILHGGSAGLVVAVQTADNRDAVLKLPAPWLDPDHKALRVLLAANGRGYVKVIRHDEESGAMLLERLGAPLASLGFSVSQQIEAICETLRAAWFRPTDPTPFLQGDQKAQELAIFIEKTWSSLGEPCSKRVIEKALHFAEARKASFNADRAVLAHGDAHAYNILEAEAGHSDCQFKFVDPEGLFIEPAYDLSVPMREWSAELLQGDPLELGRQRCRLLSDLTGVELEPIWQWGFIERVSTGLHLLELGWEAESREFLAVAESWCLD